MMSISWVERVRTAAKLYGNLGLPLRLLISACVTVIAGTGMGFVAEYAAYTWTAYYGIRPPLEGIPYLKLAVTVLTVVTLTCGALAFLMAKAITGLLREWAEGQFRHFASENGDNPLLELHRQSSATIAILVAFATALVIAGLIYCSESKFGSLPAPALEIWLTGLTVFVIVLLLWNRKVGTYIALLSVLIVLLGIPCSFFHVEVYTKILQSLGYGGGLPVQVTIAGEVSGNSPRTRLDGYLMLRTTSALVLYEVDCKRIREIPLQQVLFLDHQAFPLADRSSKLPR